MIAVRATRLLSSSPSTWLLFPFACLPAVLATLALHSLAQVALTEPIKEGYVALPTHTHQPRRRGCLGAMATLVIAVISLAVWAVSTAVLLFEADSGALASLRMGFKLIVEQAAYRSTFNTCWK